MSRFEFERTIRNALNTKCKRGYVFSIESQSCTKSKKDWVTVKCNKARISGTPERINRFLRDIEDFKRKKKMTKSVGAKQTFVPGYTNNGKEWLGQYERTVWPRKKYKTPERKMKTRPRHRSVPRKYTERDIFIREHAKNLIITDIEEEPEPVSTVFQTERESLEMDKLNKMMESAKIFPDIVPPKNINMAKYKSKPCKHMREKGWCPRVTGRGKNMVDLCAFSHGPSIPTLCPHIEAGRKCYRKHCPHRHIHLKFGEPIPKDLKIKN